jgi:hypothetical protein
MLAIPVHQLYVVEAALQVAIMKDGVYASCSCRWLGRFWAEREKVKMSRYLVKE